MKRTGYIYEQICSVDNLNKALDKACRRKRHKRFVKRILDNRDYFIEQLRQTLLTETYELNPNRYKLIIDKSSGKLRELTIPRFYPDQIIHWAVCLQLKPIFLRGMYAYNCGSIPGRGGKYGKKYIDKIYKNDRKVRYVLKTDIRKYFPHVNTEKLKELLRRKIKDAKVLRLLDAIIDNGAPGLPIGYYTSQWLANFYLEAVDHQIKEDFKIRCYERNVDDQVFMDSNKRKLHRSRLKLCGYLLNNGYGVELKDNWQLWRIHSRPLDFLGFRFYKGKTFLRKNTFLKLRRKIAKIKKRGYCTVAMARGVVSGIGWLKQIPGGKSYYLNYVKPVISKREATRIISIYDKRNNGRLIA